MPRTPANAADLGVEIRQGDYDDQTDLESSLQGINAVLPVSGMDALAKLAKAAGREHQS